MSDPVTPTFDTPLSYQANCGECETLIGMGHNYCHRCGVEIAWPGADDSDTPRRLLTGGDR